MANALSRVGAMMELVVISEVQPVWIQEILNSYATYVESLELITQLLVHSPNEQGYSLQQGIIRKGAKILIGSNSVLRTKLILALHDSVMGAFWNTGHLSKDQETVLMEGAEGGCHSLCPTVFNLSTS